MVRKTGVTIVLAAGLMGCSGPAGSGSPQEVFGLTCEGTTDFGGTIGTSFTEPGQWILKVEPAKQTVRRYVRSQQQFKFMCEGNCKTTIHNGSILIDKPELQDGQSYNLEIDRVTGEMTIRQMIRLDDGNFTTFDSKATCTKTPVFAAGREPQKF